MNSNLHTFTVGRFHEEMSQTVNKENKRPVQGKTKSIVKNWLVHEIYQPCLH